MSIATLSGVALRPGISLNGRYYSPEMVADAVAQAQERLADPDADTFNMLVCHDSEDDSAKIVGRITDWRLGEDGAALYDAVMPDTTEARTILNLIDPDDEDPYLKGVSIRGYWLGPITRTTVDGISCDTAEGLELDGLDFTKSPGVKGARVDNVNRTTPAPVESSTGRVRHRIYESVQEARVTVTEDATAAIVKTDPDTGKQHVVGHQPRADEPAARDVAVERWADHGYTAEGKRWPLDTAAQAREAWRQLRRPGVAETLSAAQLRRTRGRVVKALERHGVEVLQDGWLLERAQPTPEPVREYLDWYDGPINVEPEPVGSFTARIDNGVVCVSISSWAIDPHDLTRVARAAMAGAADAMDGLDPDMDGDVDTDVALPGETSAQRRPSATETAPDVSGVAEEAPADEAPEAPAEPSPDVADAAPVSTEEEGVPGMAEATDNAAAAPTAPAAPTFTFDQVKDLFGSFGAGFAQAQAAPQLAAAGAPAESASAAAPVVETAPAATPAATPTATVTAAAPVVEKTTAELIAEAVEAGRRAGLQEAAEQGKIGGRKGHTVAPAGVRETDGFGLPDKELHQYNEAERKRLKTAMGAEMAASFGLLPADQG